MGGGSLGHKGKTSKINPLPPLPFKAGEQGRVPSVRLPHAPGGTKGYTCQGRGRGVCVCVHVCVCDTQIFQIMLKLRGSTTMLDDQTMSSDVLVLSAGVMELGEFIHTTCSKRGWRLCSYRMLHPIPVLPCFPS